MAIERDLKTIKKRQIISRTRTAQQLKKHEKANNKQFQVITDALTLLPTEESIKATISETIRVVVNGKIDGIKADVAKVNEKVDMVGEHLKRQDNAIEDLSNKVAPIDGARNWLRDFGKVFFYIGAGAGTLYGIIRLFEVLKVIKQ